MRLLIADIVLGIAVLLLHTLLAPFISIADVVPDLPLVYVAYLAVRRGQVAGMVGGFLVGLPLDLMSGQDGMLGLSALAKTIAGFIAGYFYNENKTFATLGGFQFIVIVAVAGAVHNAVYFLIFLQGAGMSWGWVLARYGLPALLYTLAAALVPMFWIGRRHA